jgi:hypothetical protein
MAPDVGAAQPAPSHEVPIDPAPVSSPQPIGPQAPPRPPEEIKPDPRPQSRRESIQRAFDKAEAEGRPGPAKAKMGHNQPPEETEKAKQAPPQREQHREGGKFARAPEQPQVTDQTGHNSAQPAPGQQRQQYRTLPEGTPYRDPPPRFSERAKQEWHAAPEGVRADIYRMHQEVEGMHQHYRADKAEMDTIRPFHDMARQQGTSLQRALSNYVGMEQKLREDPLGGFELLANNLNLHTADGRKLGFRDIAYYALTQSPEAHQLIQQQNAAQAHQHQIGQLHQQQQALARQQAQMQYERQFTYTRSAVDQFADSHPRFDELGDLIQQELALGFDLNQAYARADRLRPSTQAAQTRTTPAQTRSDKSISGSPGGPSNGTGRGSTSKAPERRDAIQRAIRHVNGSL